MKFGVGGWFLHFVDDLLMTKKYTLEKFPQKVTPAYEMKNTTPNKTIALYLAEFCNLI